MAPGRSGSCAMRSSHWIDDARHCFGLRERWRRFHVNHNQQGRSGHQEADMTKTLIGMAILVGVAIATPAAAQDRYHGWRNDHDRDVSISVRRSFARDCR